MRKTKPSPKSKTAKTKPTTAIRKKKGGPLRSKKPGRNAVAQPRASRAPARKAAKPAAGGGLEPTSAPIARRQPVEQEDSGMARAVAIASAALDKKGEEVMVLDVRGLTSYADYFVLVTAESERQADAIADAVDEKLKELGASKVGVEGYETGRWILVDYGDVVVHVFNRDARAFYDLEGLWADAPRLQLPV